MKKFLAIFLFSCLSLQGCGGLDDIADSSDSSSSSKNSSSSSKNSSSTSKDSSNGSGSTKDEAGSGTFSYTCKATQKTTQLPYVTGKCEAVSKRYSIAQACHEYGTLDPDACELETCSGQPKGSLGCGMYKEMDALPKGIEIKNTGSSTPQQPAPKQPQEHIYEPCKVKNCSRSV